jgi:hypothetical protein
MKKIYKLIIVTILTINQLNAQQKAVTESGTEVILFENGTWKYTSPNDTTKKEIPTNALNFKKSEKSTFLVKSTKTKFGFWIDPKIWNFKKSKIEDAAEFNLELKKGDLYSIIMSEKIEVPIENLREIALENAQSASSDLEIINEEFRIVNGQKVLNLQFKGTIQGIKFVYFGYYFSNEKGTVQYLTYTSSNLFAEMKNLCEELLNGLVLVD